MTDYSPVGIEARADFARTTLTRLRQAVPENDSERVASEMMQERLEAEVAQHDAGERLRDLRILGSPVQSIRSVFDLMPGASEEDWVVIAERLEKVPAALDGLVTTLRHAMSVGITAARRQALECAKQAETWSQGSGSGLPFFEGYVAGAPAGIDDRLRTRLARAAVAASASYGEVGRYLREEYAPGANERDGCGPERYELAAQSWLGSSIDATETYLWGWDELRRIESEMAKEADRILSGASIGEAIAWLEADPDRAIEGEDNLRQWIQDLMDRTISELNGRHFDIPGPVQTVEAMIAPPGGAAAMYYTGPSEDFTRPGRTWYPTMGKTRFPLWGEVSIAYHEGVPGHHLQIGQVRYLASQLSRYQRMVSVGGHAEGWALYAERLMDELGYLDNPDYRLGQLRAQAMRAVRVIVDIGLHLDLPIPAGGDFHAGTPWTSDLAHQFALEHSYFPADFMSSEIVRYLGWPAQAICYKVGEREWLEGRAEVKSRLGADFDLKAFHARALDLGPMGLSQLRRELRRLGS
jgi:uncharacterized protein (DUF885 family)